MTRRESVNDALEQLEQLYMMRLLHQTLRQRLEEAQQAVDARNGGVPPPRFLLELFRLPQQLEEIMMMRAIQMSLAQQQPSSAPPPIAEEDVEKLELVVLDRRVLERLRKHEYLDCPVCQEDFASMMGQKVARLPCDHLFCVACVRKWLETSRTCPVCRLEVQQVEQQYVTLTEDKRKKHQLILQITPPATPVPTPPPRNPSIANERCSPPSVIMRSAEPTDARTVRDSSVSSRGTAPSVSSEFRQVSVGVGQQSQRDDVSISRRTDSDHHHHHHGGSIDSDNDADSDDGVSDANPSHQALLDEILRRRDEQHQRTVITSTPAVPPPATPARSTAVPPAAVNRTKSLRAPPSNPVRPRPVAASRSNSVVSGSSSVSSSSSVPTAPTAQVGVRGVLQRSRQR